MSVPSDKELNEELKCVEEVVRSHPGDSNLINILLEIQDRIGFLPSEGMKMVAELLGISETTVYSVATFYNRFRFIPPGKHQVHVCMGTACHVRRGGIILDSWKRRLEIDDGEVTDDREYSLDRVDCVGCCAMAPVSIVDNVVHGKVTPAAVDGILLKHELERKKERNNGSSEEEKTGDSNDG